MLRTWMINGLTLLVLDANVLLFLPTTYDYDENISHVLMIFVVVQARHESRFLTMIQQSNRAMDIGVRPRT
jgi:hypothetical protein